MLHLLTHGFNYNKYTHLSSIKLVTYIVHLEVSGEVVDICNQGFLNLLCYHGSSGSGMWGYG